MPLWRWPFAITIHVYFNVIHVHRHVCMCMNVGHVGYEQSQNTILLASTQAVYKSPHSTVWRAFESRAFECQHLTGEHPPVGSLRVQGLST